MELSLSGHQQQWDIGAEDVPKNPHGVGKPTSILVKLGQWKIETCFLFTKAAKPSVRTKAIDLCPADLTKSQMHSPPAELWAKTSTHFSSGSSCTSNAESCAFGLAGALVGASRPKLPLMGMLVCLLVTDLKANAELNSALLFDTFIDASTC
ncbi:hypothetical protein ABL841_28260 [Variovorax paradoxus]|uniref:hypothetical protein n=1 Tax=Variovorax paradoxus TaxID=34073 RepID=UPI00036736A4|nr:hypothetical protein [Variovorax paradoxus]